MLWIDRPVIQSIRESRAFDYIFRLCSIRQCLPEKMMKPTLGRFPLVWLWNHRRVIRCSIKISTWHAGLELLVVRRHSRMIRVSYILTAGSAGASRTVAPTPATFGANNSRRG